jgi:hypothetical protein
MRSLETSAQEACIQVVRKCAELYNFNAEEALKTLNLTVAVAVAVKSKKIKEKTIKLPWVSDEKLCYKSKIPYSKYMEKNGLTREVVLEYAKSKGFVLEENFNEPIKKEIKKKEFLLHIPCIEECSHKYKGKMHYTTYMKRNKLTTEQVNIFAKNNNLNLDMSQLAPPPKKPRTKKVKAEAVPTVVEEVPKATKKPKAVQFIHNGISYLRQDNNLFNPETKIFVGVFNIETQEIEVEEEEEEEEEEEKEEKEEENEENEEEEEE